MNNVSVIIPTYYRYDCLRQLVEMLNSQTMPAYEVIIADQTPCGDRPRGFYDAFLSRPNRHLLNIDRPSLSYPRNKAAARAQGDILLFLDDDIVIRNDFIEAHVSVLNEEKVDVVNGATTRQEVLPTSYPWDVRSFDPVRFFLAAPNYQWQGMMLSVSSCNFSIRRQLFLAVGGFDEHIPRMVDFELGYRLFRYGAKILYSDKPCVRHLRAPGGSRQYPKRHDHLVSALYIHKKHFPGWITTQFILKNILSKKCGINPFSIIRIIRALNVVNMLLRNKPYA